MRPQAYHLWPDEVRRLFGEMNAQARQGDEVGLQHGFNRLEAILGRLEADSPVGTARHQVARSFLDLSFFYGDRGRAADSARALKRSRGHWQAAVDDDPDDFYSRTNLAACHNLLGLGAVDAGDLDAAVGFYNAAFQDHMEAHNRQLEPGKEQDPTDVRDNLVHRAGVFCNVGHLFRVRGDADEAARYYSWAIEEIERQVPPPKDEQDREMVEFFARNWERLHGVPHFRNQGAKFLEHARWGLAELKA